jgi:hypothetical protein
MYSIQKSVVSLSKLARRTTGVNSWVKALPAGGGGLLAK